jgi:hypothetical protein
MIAWNEAGVIENAIASAKKLAYEVDDTLINGGAVRSNLISTGSGEGRKTPVFRPGM